MTLEVFSHLAFLSLRLKFVPVSGPPSSSVPCSIRHPLSSPSGRTCVWFLLPSLSSPLGLLPGEASLTTHSIQGSMTINLDFRGLYFSFLGCIIVWKHLCDFSQNVCLLLWNGSTMTAGALAISSMLLISCVSHGSWHMVHGQYVFVK